LKRNDTDRLQKLTLRYKQKEYRDRKRPFKRHLWRQFKRRYLRAVGRTERKYRAIEKSRNRALSI